MNISKRAHRALRHAGNSGDLPVNQLIGLLRIPSISTDPAHDGDIETAALWVQGALLEAGFSIAKTMKTGGHPVVYAEHHVDDSKPTVLVYGHYDVQPPDPLDLWNSDPFEPVIVDGDIVARGACDDKGQVLMHIKAAEAYLKSTGDLPVNLKFLIEGEEENGSPNLAPFIESHMDLLAADVVLISDTSFFAPGVPSMAYALRGLSYIEVTLTGPDHDLHSGVYGGGVENPLNALCRMVSDLHDEDHCVAVDGFYDHVIDLTEDERAAYRELPFDLREWMSEAGIKATKTEAGYTPLEGISGRPTLDLNGIWGGFIGEGAKTVLPSRASAKISCRLVPGQTPEDITAKLRRHFEKNVPDTMTLEVKELHGGHGAIIDTNSIAMRAAGNAMEEVLGSYPLFYREGGSIPVVADFQRIMGLNSVLLGFGLDSDAIHSPNERFGLDRFYQGIQASILFLDEYARLHASENFS